jgi:hypothetical protein
MTQHELNIIKLVDLIHDIENTNCHVGSLDGLNLLNGLVKIHADHTGTDYKPYSQKPVGPAKDYVD